MGASYSAAIVVGLPLGELGGVVNLDDLLEDEWLQTCAPFYDGDSDKDAIVGIVISKSPAYFPSQFTHNEQDITKAKHQFKEITGLEAKLWLSPVCR